MLWRKQIKYKRKFNKSASLRRVKNEKIFKKNQDYAQNCYKNFKKMEKK